MCFESSKHILWYKEKSETFQMTSWWENLKIYNDIKKKKYIYM